MRYFKVDEFECPCCGENNINPDLLVALDNARDIAEIPFVIESGFRCVEHNRAVGGKEDSSHLTGLAADIRATTSTDRYLILNALLFVGFTRIGIGKTFIHADIDRTKSQEVVWVY